MNYTSIEINGEKVGLKFGMASFRYLANTKFVENDDALNEIGIAKILYSGYYNNCIIKDAEPKFTLEDFVDLIEANLKNEEFINEIKRIIDLWSANDIIKQASNGKVEEPKKKRGRK